MLPIFDGPPRLLHAACRPARPSRLVEDPSIRPDGLTNRDHLSFLCKMELPRSEVLTLPGGPTRIEWRRNRRAQRVSLRIDPCVGGVVVTLPTRARRGAGV